MEFKLIHSLFFIVFVVNSLQINEDSQHLMDTQISEESASLHQLESFETESSHQEDQLELGHLKKKGQFLFTCRTDADCDQTKSLRCSLNKCKYHYGRKHLVMIVCNKDSQCEEGQKCKSRSGWKGKYCTSN